MYSTSSSVIVLLLSWNVAHEVRWVRRTKGVLLLFSSPHATREAVQHRHATCNQPLAYPSDPCRRFSTSSSIIAVYLCNTGTTCTSCLLCCSSTMYVVGNSSSSSGQTAAFLLCWHSLPPNRICLFCPFVFLFARLPACLLACLPACLTD